MLQRIKGTVGDVAETIKRAFVGPKVHSVSHLIRVAEPACKASSSPTANVLVGSLLAQPVLSESKLFTSASLPVKAPDVQFKAHAMLESGKAFETGAKPINVSFVWSGVVKSADIPRMNTPAMKTADGSNYVFPTKFHAISRFYLEHGETYKLNPTIGTPQCYRSVERALLVPIVVTPEDHENISKALLMRYTLQLVKESGENVKNLEIIGLYRVPKKGLKSLKHDASTGNLHIVVGAEAQKTTYGKLILARKKSDSKMVSCAIYESA